MRLHTVKFISIRIKYKIGMPVLWYILLQYFNCRLMGTIVPESVCRFLDLEAEVEGSNHSEEDQPDLGSYLKQVFCSIY